MGLSQQEHATIVKHLGRELLPIEERIFVSLWSEHCSYRHSRPFLKRFERTHAFGAMGVGQNSGGVSLPSGKQVFFKIESHNHPSYIEPKEGAATGVGGILRDIFAMGARPIMTGDLLCFGIPDDDPWMQKLIPGVVKGISDYGNSIGIPNAGGDTKFDPSYQGNILVNVFALGIREANEGISAILRPQVSGSMLQEDGRQKTEDEKTGIQTSKLDIHLFGGKTGRDGIGGAAMASETFEEGSEALRPQVQISDPYMGKRILEICLALVKEGLVIALQDCGAAGMSGGLFELCDQNNCGATIHLDHVPLRTAGMSPDEIAVSESQERMVAIASADKQDAIASLCEKWDVPHAVIGTLEPNRTTVDMWYHQECITKLDPHFVCEGHRDLYKYIKLKDFSPLPSKAQSPIRFSLQSATDHRLPEDGRRKTEKVDQSINFSKHSHELVKSLKGCSREWIVHQYDQHVCGRTVLSPLDHPVGVHMATANVHADADVDEVVGVRLALSPKWAGLHPRAASWQMLRDAVWHMKALGLEPLGVTNGLNFASPENPEILDDFDATVFGLAEAAEQYQLPVVSGNVSFYNASGDDQAILPTLALGVVGGGQLKDLSPHLKRVPERCAVYVLRDPKGQCGVWPEQMTRENLNDLLMDASSFEKRLWETLSSVETVRVFHSHLKPIWDGFLMWVLGQSRIPDIALNNLEAADVLTIGGHVMWTVVPDGVVIQENSDCIVEKVGTLDFTSEKLAFVVYGKSTAKEVLDIQTLKQQYDQTLIQKGRLSP